MVDILEQREREKERGRVALFLCFDQAIGWSHNLLTGVSPLSKACSSTSSNDPTSVNFIVS